MLTTFGEKEGTTKVKEKAKATAKETKAKASTGAKDTTKEAITKEDTTKVKEKATQDPKAMDHTIAKETTANQKEKEAATT